MRRILFLIACIALLLAGCAQKEISNESVVKTADAQPSDLELPSGEPINATALDSGLELPSGEPINASAQPSEWELPSSSNLPLTYMDLSAEEAKQLIDETPDLIIIDVSPHYDEGHLPGAVHYYLADGSLDKAIPKLDKEKPYLVYCHVDSVSIAGAQKLIDAGFTEVYRLEGNYAGWVAAGYEVEK